MKVTGTILTGGRGSRLGGADKGLVDYGGRPLVEWVIDRIRPQVDELLINANRNIERYATYGCPVVGDVHADYRGPLAGFEAAMAHASYDWVMLVPCDTPALPSNLRERLQGAVIASTARLAVVDTPVGLQPTVVMVHRDLALSITRFLESGQRRVKDWISTQPSVRVHFDNPSDFANLNTEASLKRD